MKVVSISLRYVQIFAGVPWRGRRMTAELSKAEMLRSYTLSLHLVTTSILLPCSIVCSRIAGLCIKTEQHSAIETRCAHLAVHVATKNSDKTCGASC